MSRNIDIAIKQFKEIATDNRNEQHYWENRPNPNAGTLEYAQKACESAEYHEYIVACLEELKTRREADKWNVIRTEADLPKESDNYLIQLDNNWNEQLTAFFSKGVGFCFMGSVLKDVIAWKPLPEPYESEAESLDNQRAVEDTEYCERHEPTYNPDDGSM